MMWRITLHKYTIWVVNWVGIGIPYPTQNAPNNLNNLEECCEVLTPYITNGEELELV